MEEEILEETADVSANENEASSEKDARFDELELKLKALEEENKALKDSVEALKTLPHFSAQSKNQRDSFSAVREIFRKK